MPDVEAASQSRGAAKTGLNIILFGRTILNVPFRMSYLFLPAITRGLGVPLSAGGALVSVGSLAGLVAPLFGALADWSGGRQVMVLGTGLLAAGALLAAGLPWYAVTLVAFAIVGLAKAAYDPAMQAYLGHRVPYERRGRALGLAELAWSASLLAMPVCGWLIDGWGWRAPYLLVGISGVLVWWLTHRALPPDHNPSQEKGAQIGGVRGPLTSLVQASRQLWKDRHARLALASTALIAFAQDNVMVVYGAWMEDRFGLTVTSLGAATLVIAGAELTAELGVAFISDRFGKRRSVFVSVLGTAAAYLILPHLTSSLALALLGTAVLILFFEYSIVGLIPIISGMNATSRGTLMSLNRTTGSAGRMIAAPLGVALYSTGDISRNGPVSALACILLLGVLLLLRERGH
jgi:predicted MFS family arabinose efflux permease